MHPIEVLENYWNYTNFKPLQEKIIDAVLAGEDTFALLPTGGGKSICFQIPALINEGICVVISPLIALMKNQVLVLKQKGIKAIALTSGLPYTDLEKLLDNCIYGNYKFLYLSPERLKQPLVQERLQRMKVNLIAVDEAHCISQWGNDFRPAYLDINILRQLHPHVNCIALTATAKPKVVRGIMKHLDFVNPKLYKASFIRPNISYQIVNTNDKLYQLSYVLKKYKGSSIVYVRTRRESELINNYLIEHGFSSSFYHGGIPNEEKQKKLQKWLNEQISIIVATTAFGMGIDKSNVKTVIHFNLPENLESYYQEAGRAGRNGKAAYTFLLYKTNDEEQLKNQFLNALPSVNYVKKLYRKLSSYFQISYGDGENESFQFNFKAFCSKYNLKPGLTYNALMILDRHSIISLNQNFNFKTKVQFVTTNKVLFKYIESNLELNTIIKTILRTYGGVFDFETPINLNLIVNKSGLTEKKVIQQLEQLQKDNIISLKISNTDSEIVFLKPREDDLTINPIAKSIIKQHVLKHKNIEAVINYIKNNEVCKQKQLLKYFSEKNIEPCGNCSVCLNRNLKFESKNSECLKNSILKALKNKELTSRSLLQFLSCTDKELFKLLKELLADQKIKINPNNTYALI